MEETKKHIDKARLAFDVAMALLLAFSALGMAWATWMSQLHGSNEAQNYAASAALRAKGGSMMNTSSLSLTTSLNVWNDLVGLDAMRKYYESEGDTASADLIKAQIEYVITTTCDEDTEKLVREALAQDPVPNLFSDEVQKSYYTEAQSYLDEAEELIQQGNKDNLLSDAFGFVNLLYSIVMFLLASLNIIKRQSAKTVILCASGVAFVLATIYMLCLPLPTGFDFANYLQFLRS